MVGHECPCKKNSIYSTTTPHYPNDKTPCNRPPLQKCNSQQPINSRCPPYTCRKWPHRQRITKNKKIVFFISLFNIIIHSIQLFYSSHSLVPPIISNFINGAFFARHQQHQQQQLQQIYDVPPQP
jgi:hypothetical protein